MQRRLIIARYGLGLESDVLDRELRFQHFCHGTPHRFHILSATNRNMRGKAGILVSDRTQMQVVNPVHAYNLIRSGTDGLEVEPTRHALQSDTLPIAKTHSRSGLE